MLRRITKGNWWKAAWVAILCAGFMLCLAGCEAVSFYGQAVSGQMEILGGEKPVPKLMADPKTPDKLKAKFKEIQKLREFAATELKLPAENEYVNYTDLRRDYVVWNVNVAPTLSLQPKTWWFPVVGEASYRGYFSEAAARRYARKWQEKGWDVYVDGVEAYSTLGWFRDPLLNTFIYEPESDLADLIFHELAHRRLFIAGDTDFNEAFATAVAAEGVRRWYAATSDKKSYEDFLARQRREQTFIQLIMDARSKLAKVYEDPRLPDEDKIKRKEDIISGLRASYEAAKKAWGGDKGFDYWFDEPINNAKLNTVSAYYDLTPAFTALLAAQNGDMEKFYAAVAGLGKLPIYKRHEVLRGYLKSH